jgi:hypothetical protein
MKLRLVFAIALVTQLWPGFAGGRAASAQVIGGNRYGIVTIHNKTNSIINYWYRWGNGPWYQRSLEPGHYRYFYHQYDFANENRSPSFQIRFDSGARSGFVATKGYALKRKPAPWPNPEFGRHYDFKDVGGHRIDLFAR